MPFTAYAIVPAENLKYLRNADDIDVICEIPSFVGQSQILTVGIFRNEEDAYQYIREGRSVYKTPVVIPVEITFWKAPGFALMSRS